MWNYIFVASQVLSLTAAYFVAGDSSRTHCRLYVRTFKPSNTLPRGKSTDYSAGTQDSVQASGLQVSEDHRHTKLNAKKILKDTFFQEFKARYQISRLVCNFIFIILWLSKSILRIFLNLDLVFLWLSETCSLEVWTASCVPAEYMMGQVSIRLDFVGRSFTPLLSCTSEGRRDPPCRPLGRVPGTSRRLGLAWRSRGSLDRSGEEARPAGRPCRLQESAHLTHMQSLPMGFSSLLHRPRSAAGYLALPV